MGISHQLFPRQQSLSAHPSLAYYNNHYLGSTKNFALYGHSQLLELEHSECPFVSGLVNMYTYQEQTS